LYDELSMIHPASEVRYVSSAVGYGVVATRFIPKGSITWVHDDLDQVIESAQVPDMPPMLQWAIEKYSYLNRRGERVLCWDHSRFLNHSCNPTSLAPGFDFEIAVRDIHEGEEITDDYGLLNLESDFSCSCGEKNCRGTIAPEDFALYADRWDALIADAASHLNRVEQPLWDLVREKAEINKVLLGQARMPSCRVHRMLDVRASATDAA